jgi:Tol biopolymer transport system component
VAGLACAETDETDRKEGREPRGWAKSTRGMRWDQILSVALAGVLLLPACSEKVDERAQDRPSVSTTTSHGPDSPLSGRIVFDNFQDIWSINADGTGLRRLTRSPWPEFDPSLSPDGRLIAFRAEPHEHPQLWIMNAGGTGQHRLTRDGGFPTWSPDGSMIAYAPGGGASGRSWIAIMNADGSNNRRLPHTDYGEYPSWSPDGKRIAFNSNLSGHGLMYIVDVDGSRVVDLSGVGQGHEVAWSPDGRSILFASQRDHSDNWDDIYVMRPDGSDVRRLTRNRAELPAWSPDGRYIAFASPEGLGVMRADGSGVTLLPIEGVGEATFPDWR